jgi:hypothetical protein
MKDRNRAVWVFFDSEDIHRVLLRLADAGWISGTSGTNPETLKVHYTKNGAFRMSELSLLVAPYNPRFFGIPPTTPKPAAPTIFEAVFSSSSIAPELISPPLTEREQWAFIELLSMMALRNLNGGLDERLPTEHS